MNKKNAISTFDITFLIGICLVTFLSRIFLLDDRGLSGDEKYTTIVSQFMVQEGSNQKESLRNPATPYFTPKQFWAERSFDDFLEVMARRENGSGSLYFLLTHYWTKIFGLSDASFRSVSLVFTILLLPLLFVFTKKHFAFTRHTPYIVTVLAAISPFYLNYGIVARNYAMTYFWILLATYYFLNFLKEPSSHFWKSKNFWLYSLVSVAVVFGHHSSVVIFPLHLLIAVVSLRFRKLIPLGIAMLLPVSLLGLWSLSEGGKYTYDFMKNSALQYQKVALEGTELMVKFSTPENIMRQFVQVFTYLYFPISGLADTITGVKNTLLCSFSGVLLFFVLNFITDTKKRIVLAALVLLAPLPFYSIAPLQFMLAAIGSSLIGFGLLLYLKNIRSAEWQTVGIMAIAPLVFLILYAVIDGITIRINARYAGFAYPFLLLLVVIAVQYLLQKLKQPLAVYVYVAIFTGAILIPEWMRIIKDEQPQYFHFVRPNRLPNPYLTLAKKIESVYEKGDTVLYCSEKLGGLTGTSKMPDYSMQDAQYTNLYLTKNADFIQRGDTTEKDKVYIWKNKLQKKIFLMDLSDKRY